MNFVNISFASEAVYFSIYFKHLAIKIYILGGARYVIPLIVHVTHFYYYKNI